MERLTAHSSKGLKLRKGKKFVELLSDKNLTLSALTNLAELEDKLESGQLVELPNGWLETLKLLTVAAVCYADIKHIIESRMNDSKEIADLYFQCPNVQGSTNLWALSSLADSKLDCNKIKGFEEILNAMPIFKEIVNKQP